MQDEPRVQEEPPIEVSEPPIEASWEFTEVGVEKVDDTPLYPSSAPESDTSTSNAASSDAPTVITSSQPEVLKLNYIDS